MELYFLGTGAGVPSKRRNVSSIALSLLQEKGSIWLFDCGEATQHQILYTSIKPRKIEKIFITHLHGDHIFGLPGFLGSRSFQGGTEPLEIYGPSGIKQFVKTALEISQTHLKYDIHFKEIHEGIIFEDEHFRVIAKKLQHGIPSFGFRVEEKDKIGELLPEKLLKAGIQPGPIYKKIKEKPQIVLDDGTILYREQFVGPRKKGKIISILGDTRYAEEHVAFIKQSDVLVHEATFGVMDEHLAYEYFHSSANQAAKIAQRGQAGKLLLTHISSRYQEEDEVEILKEAQTIFPNTRIVHDLERIEV
jgi:ribonuclease Z